MLERITKGRTDLVLWLARGTLLDGLEQMKIPRRRVDHLYFVAEHFDHHLAHIWAKISP